MLIYSFNLNMLFFIRRYHSRVCQLKMKLEPGDGQLTVISIKIISGLASPALFKVSTAYGKHESIDWNWKIIRTLIDNENDVSGNPHVKLRLTAWS